MKQNSSIPQDQRFVSQVLTGSMQCPREFLAMRLSQTPVLALLLAPSALEVLANIRPILEPLCERVALS